MIHYLKVCFHTTYIFLKVLIIVCHVSAMDFPLTQLSHENLHSLLEMGWKFFSAESTPPYCLSLHTVFYLFIYFLVLVSFLLVLFFSNQSLGTYFHRYQFQISFHDSVSGFHMAGLALICSQSCCEVLFFVGVEGMLIYFLWSMSEIKPCID